MNAHGSPPPAAPPLRCPDCAAPLRPGAAACPRCALVLVGPLAQRLWEIDTQLVDLADRSRRLRAERSEVHRLLRRESGAPRPVGEPAAPVAPGHAARSGPSGPPAPHAGPQAGPVPVGAYHRAQVPPPAPRRSELSQLSAQNLILGLGGLLVGIAALVFAVWTWSDLTTGTRALILTLTTLFFAGVALPLHRRGLASTAETFGALGAALLCVDALALYLVSDGITNGPGYAAAALAVIGALLVLYPLLVPLRAPRVIAVLLVQPVPVLLVAASSWDGRWPWMLTALAVTALLDVLVGTRLGAPRPGVPVRTLHVVALVVWALTIGFTVLAVALMSSVTDPLRWWSVAATLLVSGAASLLLARQPRTTPAERARGRFHTVAGLLALGLVPLAAGPAHLPVLPRVPGRVWSDDPSLAMRTATDVLGLVPVGSAVPSAPAQLSAILVGAVLAVGVAALPRRALLVPVLALVAPPTLLPVPLLLGFPLVAASVWALLLGAALIVWATLLRTGHRSRVPAVTGFLTLLTGLAWALPEWYTSAAALLLVATSALVAALAVNRTAGDRAEGPAATLYAAATALWLVVLLVGAPLLVSLLAMPRPDRIQWWLLAALALLAGATALRLGRTAPPFGNGSVADPRPALTWAGLLLLPLAPLAAVVQGPPSAPLFAGPHGVWAAPLAEMLEPASAVLGYSAPPGAGAAALSALGLLAASALAVGTVRLADRRLVSAAMALTVPAALVPLPVVLGLPYVVAVVWALAVGAALTLSVARTGDRPHAWVATATGLATLLLGLAWALPERYTSLVAAVLLACAALLGSLELRRLGRPGTDGPGSPVRLVYSSVLGIGVADLVLVGALVADSAAAVRHTPAVWALAALAVLGIATTALVVGRLPYAGPWPTTVGATPAGAGPAPQGYAGAGGFRTPGAAPVPGAPPAARGGAPRPTIRPAPSVSPYSVLGLVLLTIAPLVAGPPGLPVFAFAPWGHGVAAAPPEALIGPAHTVLGLPGPADTATGLAFALGCLLAGVLAVLAARLVDRPRALHAAALAGPAALVPLPVALGAPFLFSLVWTLAVGAGLALWAARLADPRLSRLPASTGLFVLLLGFGWSLAEPFTTAAVLAFVAVAASFAAALSRTTVTAVGATALATAATGGLALALPLALDLPVQLAALGPLLVVAGVAAVAPRLRSPLLEATEVPAAVWALVVLGLSSLAHTAVPVPGPERYGAFAEPRPELVAVALAVLGVISLGSAVRPGRRPLAVVGGLLMLAAMWTVLAAWDVGVAEAYTVVPALAALVLGWEWSRKAKVPPSSWAAYGGGLALLLLPTVGLVLGGQDLLWRVPALLAAGLAVAVWGLRGRLQAALVIGGAALVLTSLRAFGPPLWDLTVLLPNWVPFAAAGALLLVVGARYEANLARLRRLGRTVAAMR
ncbi:SCO7613 C-terminal domain-containing membrane protein [Nocardiopsis sp. NRRL B-16309]|uniref:SCO7613 C-terminal domain-containing membrane protein n=1 Tax=Nocardiopsis sp. NRRL B-16309 TaxID=1519494 RepID=UPI0006AE3AE0|nr:hypothetical protein [Nocardiopsis sp. NRRL B-16309]KOX18300.1 hypothetical protein ADL05_07580 [Nocardiopsis sp. NRRL B-16309]